MKLERSLIFIDAITDLLENISDWWYNLETKVKITIVGSVSLLIILLAFGVYQLHFKPNAVYIKYDNGDVQVFKDCQIIGDHKIKIKSGTELQLPKSATVKKIRTKP